MSISTAVKNQLIHTIQTNCPSVQYVYGHEETNPTGWPTVCVVTTSVNGEFVDTSHNSRVYAFRITAMFPFNQDMPGLPAGTNRDEYAEQTLATVVDEIINAVDTNFMLEATPVLYLEAADAEWGEAAIESGIVKACAITLRIYTEYQVQ
jgi:hypothetical protein